MWLLNALLFQQRVIHMPRIGLRELKTRASEVLRDVEDNQARYVITRRGHPQAIIIPYSVAEEREPVSDRRKAWLEFSATLRGVGEQWTYPGSTDDLLEEMRR
jgi:prevent-host-death family protein